MGGHVQMAKSDPEAQRKFSLSAHGWKDEFGSFNLEALKFLMHFREPGSSLLHILIFFLFSFFLYTHFFLFLSFFFLIFSFSFSSNFFLFAPLEL
jgi:hypothetical protein